MSEISSVVFDIGNVFVPWDPRLLYEKLISDEEKLNYFLEEIVTPDWNLEHDRGRPFADGVALLVGQYPEHESLIRQFDSRWEEMLGDVIVGTVDVLERLVARGMAVYAITNFSAEKWPVFCASYRFTDYFADVIVSGDEKLVKPDPAIFQLAIDRFKLVPEQSIFIDDRLENVHAAQDEKMQGHHFTDPALLISDFTARGLI